MPVKVPIFCYKCEICGTLYTDASEEKCISSAQFCESKGTPEYRYTEGFKFKAAMIFETEVFEWTIREKAIDKRTTNHGHTTYHEPSYLVSNGEKSVWVPEEYIDQELKVNSNEILPSL